MIGDWITSKPVVILGKVHQAPRILGPDKDTSAVVIKSNGGTGTVKIVDGAEELGVVSTNSNCQQQAFMLFLKSGCKCIVEKNAIVKYVTSV